MVLVCCNCGKPQLTNTVLACCTEKCLENPSPLCEDCFQSASPPGICWSCELNLLDEQSQRNSPEQHE